MEASAYVVNKIRSCGPRFRKADYKGLCLYFYQTESFDMNFSSIYSVYFLFSGYPIKIIYLAKQKKKKEKQTVKRTDVAVCRKHVSSGKGAPS